MQVTLPKSGSRERSEVSLPGKFAEHEENPGSGAKRRVTMDCSEVLASGPEGRSPKPSCNPSVVMLQSAKARRGNQTEVFLRIGEDAGLRAAQPHDGRRRGFVERPAGPLDKTEALAIVRDMRTEWGRTERALFARRRSRRVWAQGYFATAFFSFPPRFSLFSRISLLSRPAGLDCTQCLAH